MTPDQRQGVLQFLMRRATYESLVALGIDPLGQPDFVVRSVREARAAVDGESLELALSLAFRCDLLGTQHAALVAELLRESWHQRHEDLASVLQRFRDPSTADALAGAAVLKHAYLADDDSHALARKCTWALADIGTPQAREHLERLARHEDEEIAGYAQKRLDNWDAELGRKGVAPRRPSGPLTP